MIDFIATRHEWYIIDNIQPIFSVCLFVCLSVCLGSQMNFIYKGNPFIFICDDRVIINEKKTVSSQKVPPPGIQTRDHGFQR